MITIKKWLKEDKLSGWGWNEKNYNHFYREDFVDG